MRKIFRFFFFFGAETSCHLVELLWRVREREREIFKKNIDNTWQVVIHLLYILFEKFFFRSCECVCVCP